MNKILFSFFLVFFIINCKAQKYYVNNFFGLSIQIPENWKTIDSSDVVPNLSRINFSKQQLEKIMELHQGTIKLLALAKRPLNDGKQDLIPTINIGVRYTNRNLIQLKAQLNDDFNSYKESLDDFHYITPIIIEIVNHYQVIKTIFSYNIIIHHNKFRARTYSYTFLRFGYHIQINFSDGDLKEDESQLFDKLVKTIKLTH